MRALAKVPADRFPTAADFAQALATPGETRETAVMSSTARAPRPTPDGRAGGRRARARRARPGGVPPVAAPEAVLDPNLVAVVPFRVGGAAPALGYLREGMIDLVAAG